MKKAIVLIILAVGLLAACGSEKFGPGGDSANAQLVKVKDVLIDPNLSGKPLILEGKITSQCGSSGCWLFLDDGTGQIYVDLSTNGFSMPPKMGKKAKVIGRAAESQNGIVVIASQVEVK